MRTYNPLDIAMGLAVYHEIIGGEFNPFEWIADERNIALQVGDSFGIFQYDADGVYTGHYFFSLKDRGKKAIALGKEMLKDAFDQHDVKVVRGLTPLQNRPARWMARQLGFKSFGVVDIISGPCELFIQTADQFRKN